LFSRKNGSPAPSSDLYISRRIMRIGVVRGLMVRAAAE
jgi:hypothetical protein